MIILLIIAMCSWVWLWVWLCFLILPIKKKQINLISSNKKEDDLLLPIIDIEIAGIKTKAIIDTGSSLNIINKRFAMNNNLFVDYAKEKEVDSFLTAQGETSTDGVLACQTVINNEIMRDLEFVVYDMQKAMDAIGESINSEVSIILGVEAIKKFNITIKMNEGVIIL